ncbi:MAG: HAD family hydrolase [Muribaculaceae bacterium]|nr:HAD family hydrolase [Muribaculaceae bacterium]
MGNISNNIRGIIFDYGGTIDSRGVHWSWIIWDGYQQAQVPITLEQFREAYVFAERELAKVRHILPSDNFLQLLRKKMVIELQYVAQQGWTQTTQQQFDEWAESIAQHCYREAQESIAEAMPVLESLSKQFPLMLVSNFYGNIDEVVRDLGIRHFFKGIIESAVVGIRKPNPTLFRLGVDALELPADQVLVVGDSLKKDILPAHSLGCATAWMQGPGWAEDENDAIDIPADTCRLTSLTQLL